jgi:lipopolysaccharide transport system ATP-binding protein
MSGDFAIRTVDLGKQYQLGARGVYRGLRETIMDGIWKPLRRLSRHTRATPVAERPGSIWALRGATLDIRVGEVVGIIGPNGAGKSTVLKILSRITDPSEGYAIVNGRVGSLLEVGTGFHAELSGRDNVYLNGAILGMKRAEIARKFDEIVAFAGVEGFIDTAVKHYSTGMYVRLAFAVAAHLETEILLIDEVLAVGDVAFQKKCLGRIGEVARSGRTVVFVSHNMAAVSRLCERVILLYHGGVLAAGEPGAAIRQYLDLSSSVSRTSLRDVRVRRGDGPLRFTAFRCETEAGLTVTTVASGELVRLVLDYESERGQPANNVLVSILIFTADGVRVANLGNHYFDLFNPAPATGSFVCILPKLGLRAGRYSLDFYCGVNEEVSDWMEGIGTLEVVDGDYYGTGRITTMNSGLLFMEHSWSCESEGHVVRSPQQSEC